MPSQEDIDRARYRFVPEGADYTAHFPPLPLRTSYLPTASQREEHLDDLKAHVADLERRLRDLEEYREPTPDEKEATFKMLQAKVKEEFKKRGIDC